MPLVYTTDPLRTDPYILPPELATLYGFRLSDKRRRTLTKLGQFPVPTEISPGRIGWPKSQLDQHFASRPKRTYAPPKSSISPVAT